MKTVTEAEVRDVLPMIRSSLDTLVDTSVALGIDMNIVNAAWQIALMEKAAELAKKTFATSRVDFALAAKELYDDDRDADDRGKPKE